MFDFRFFATAMAVSLLFVTPATACGAPGNECVVRDTNPIGEIDDFWRILRAGPTQQASMTNLKARFGSPPFEFEGDEKNHHVHVIIEKIGIDDVGYYSHSPVVYVDVIVREPMFSGPERRSIPITISAAPGGL